MVRDFKTGEIVYSYNGNVPRSTASNLKLLIGGAAIEKLGLNYRFSTKLYYDGTIKNGVLNGNLYVVGTGDPTLMFKDLQTFAWKLKYVGVKHITGYIFGDVSRFSGDTLSPGVVPKEEFEAYAARVSPITLSPTTSYDSGTIQVIVKPGKVGARPKITGSPTLGGMEIVNKAKTVKKGSKNTLSVKRSSGSNKIVVSGNVPIGSSNTRVISMRSPYYSTLHALSEAIKQRGITFKQKYLIAPKKLPKGAKLLQTKQSMTLGEMYPVFMKRSNNPMGDIFVKTMGYETYGVGDFSHGIKVVKEYGTSLGLDMKKWTIVDGSGLSKRNKTSPNELTLLMKKLQSKPYYKTFYNGLIIGGHKDPFHAGALKNRFTETKFRNRVVGKTGHISGVHTLTGVATGYYNGRKYIFSIMSENNAGTTKNMDNVIKKLILHK